MVVTAPPHPPYPAGPTNTREIQRVGCDLGVGTRSVKVHSGEAKENPARQLFGTQLSNKAKDLLSRRGS